MTRLTSWLALSLAECRSPVSTVWDHLSNSAITDNSEWPSFHRSVFQISPSTYRACKCASHDHHCCRRLGYDNFRIQISRTTFSVDTERRARSFRHSSQLSEPIACLRGNCNTTIRVCRLSQSERADECMPRLPPIMSSRFRAPAPAKQLYYGDLTEWCGRSLLAGSPAITARWYAQLYTESVCQKQTLEGLHWSHLWQM